MKSKSSYFPLKTICRAASSNVLFGPTTIANEIDSLYPDRKLKLNSIILWNPELHVHVGVASYIDAYRNDDKEAIAKLESWGMPKGANFGYAPNEDLTCTYSTTKNAKPKKPRAKKAESCKVMRAKYAAEFEDGTKFKPGEIVKVVFRKKFVDDGSGERKFRNVYRRPSQEELDEFLGAEAC